MKLIFIFLYLMLIKQIMELFLNFEHFQIMNNFFHFLIVHMILCMHSYLNNQNEKLPQIILAMMMKMEIFYQIYIITNLLIYLLDPI